MVQYADDYTVFIVCSHRQLDFKQRNWLKCTSPSKDGWHLETADWRDQRRPPTNLTPKELLIPLVAQFHHSAAQVR